MNAAPLWAALIAIVCSGPALSANLCPHADCEAAGPDGGPAGWTPLGKGGSWSSSDRHSGRRSLALAAAQEARCGWVSQPISLVRPGRQLVLSVWARLSGVTGGQGAWFILEHLDGSGRRIGQSAVSTLGGASQSVADEPWRQYFAFSQLTPEVKAVRIGLWLRDARGAAWFDDVELAEYEPAPLTRPRPLRRGLRLSGGPGVAIVDCAGGGIQAARIQAALKARGFDAPILAHDQSRGPEERRDLVVLGNLATSKAAEQLYLHYYSYEDLYDPGAGGCVLRPLVDPFGDGANVLVVGASDDKGLARGVDRLLELVASCGPVLEVPLIVEPGAGYQGIRFFPWRGPGPYREMEPAGAYLKSGDLAHAHEYRRKILKEWLAHSDQALADRQNALHLIYHSMTMSWDLMESCGVFSDEERLLLTNQLLKIMRSNQASGYAGISTDLLARRSRTNHDVRNARSFYFGWRYFAKYHRAALRPEVERWRWQVENFFKLWHFGSHRTGDSGISQHAFCGSMNAVVDVALMQPDWARRFFDEGHARRMGDWAIAVCNNMGQAVMLGDAGPADYPCALFAKLAYRLNDGRYRFMIDKRGAEQTASDEPMRGFNNGLAARHPQDHVGLKIIPQDRLYFDSMLQHKEGVAFERAFDKIALRSGFDPADEYLLLEGEAGRSHAQDDANTIAEFSANGRRWLCEPDIFMGPSLAFHNAVTVTRDGLGCPDTPQAAELLAQASGKGYAYTATRLPRYSGTAWTRHLVWLPGRYTFVLDEITADVSGQYSLVLGWRSLGRPELAPGLFTSAQDDRSTGRNRFFLRFPTGVPAALDRDTDLLGAFVPESPHHDKAINVLEQSHARALQPGRSACFQNVFWAAAGDTLRQVELRRLNEHCALLRSGDEIALVGAGAAAATCELKGLRVTGRMFYIRPDFAFGVEMSPADGGGRALRSEAIRAVLANAWDEADQGPAADVADPWAGLARLTETWAARLTASPLSLAVARGRAGPRLAAGTQPGLVLQFDRTAQPAGQFRAGGAVHTLAAGDLDGDETEELLVGSDDEHAYALDASLAPLWKFRPPFQIDASTPGFCTMRSAKVRKIMADDLDGDGRPEVLLAAGNMRLHCLDRAGGERWRFTTAYGTVTTMTAADVFGDGHRRILAGPTLTRPRGQLWILDDAGRTLQTLVFGAWGANLQALAVADLNGDGRRTIFCGGNEGNLIAWPADPRRGATLHKGRNDHLWLRNFTRPIRAMIAVPDRGLVAVAGDSGCLAGVDETGRLAWNLALGNPVVHAALVRRRSGPPRLAAGCANGRVFLVDVDGKPLALFEGRAGLRAMVAADLDGDGIDEIVVATAAPDRLSVVGTH